MITLILAAVLAQPCLLPQAHHHKPLPVASCVAPLPAALVQSEPEPVEFAVYRYYDTPGMCYQVDVPAAPTGLVVTENPTEGYYYGYYAPGLSIPIPGGILVITGQPPAAVPPQDPPYTPPGVVVGTGPLPPPTMVTKAPEIDAGSGLMAVTLLAGTLVVLRGRRR